jgi:hypothetical protein
MLKRDRVSNAFLFVALGLTTFAVFLPAMNSTIEFSPGSIRCSVLTFVFAAVFFWLLHLSWKLTGDAAGVFLSSRNKYSFSRFQMVGWTYIVLSSLAAAAICNVWGVGTTDGHYISSALDIYIDTNLLVAMGISYASGIAAPGVLALKAQGQDAGDDEVQAAQGRSANDGSIMANGSVMVRSSSARARLSDIFSGDDIADAGTIDLSKVQQFIVTLIIWLAILGMIIDSFLNYNFDDWCTVDAKIVCVNETSNGLIQSLPPLGDRILWLLGLSHAGYIAYKAVPKTSPTGADGGSSDDAVADTILSPFDIVTTSALPPPLPGNLRG